VDNTKIIREFRDRKSYPALKIYGRALEKSQYLPEKKLIYKNSKTVINFVTKVKFRK
jgi:hypothetical protein